MTNTELPALLPCPFCGNKEAPRIVEDNENGVRALSQWVVVCDASSGGPGGCGASGGYDLTPTDAARNWNTRAALAAQSAPAAEPTPAQMAGVLKGALRRSGRLVAKGVAAPAAEPTKGALCGLCGHPEACLSMGCKRPAAEPTAPLDRSALLELFDAYADASADGVFDHETRRIAAQIVAAFSDAAEAVQPVAPDGWQLVPKDPTQAMVANAMKECGGIGGGSCGEYTGIDGDDMRSVWEAMLAAAPAAQREASMLTREQAEAMVAAERERCAAACEHFAADLTDGKLAEALRDMAALMRRVRPSGRGEARPATEGTT